MEKTKGEIGIDSFEEILTSLEISLEPAVKSLCVYLMYNETKDVSKLKYGSLIELLQACTEYIEEDKKESDNDYQDNFEPDESNSKEISKITKDSNLDDKKNSIGKNGQEEVELNEEQLIEIAQSCFQAIAQYMKEHGLTAKKLFENRISQKSIEGESTDVITIEAFLEKIREMEIESMSEIHQACLIKILSVGDNENLIKINDLIQILEDYEANNNSPPVELANNDLLNYEELDNISMIILFALTEYLIKANYPLYDLFDNYIYNHTVTESDGSVNSLEVIDAENFFKVMQTIGVKIEDEGYENLQNFLTIDQNCKDKISLDKLKDAVKKFATNEKLREKAHKCYKELFNEMGYEMEESIESNNEPKSK